MAPRAALPLFLHATLALLLLVAACSAAPGVFQVRRRFPAGGGAAALRAHDGRRHGRLLATDTGYVRAPDGRSSCSAALAS